MGGVTDLDPAGAPRGPVDSDRVEVRLPADGAYLAVLRTAAAGLAARLDFTLDEIEDLRIAVDEACALLIQQARPASRLRCVFDVDAGALAVTVTGVSDQPRLPREDTFAWSVLSALAGEVRTAIDGDTVTIGLRKVRSRGIP